MQQRRSSFSELALIQSEPLYVLKHDDQFAVFNPRGDFHGLLHDVGPSIGADGRFQDDTRILSRLTLRLADPCRNCSTAPSGATMLCSAHI